MRARDEANPREATPRLQSRRGQSWRVSVIGIVVLCLALSSVGCTIGPSHSTAPPRAPLWRVSKLPPRLGLPISQHFIALDPANGYNRVVHLADVGDVNGDNFRAVDIVWSTSSANRAGEPTMKRVILFGSRRLAWR